MSATVPSYPPRSQRLARAFALAVDPGVSPDTAAASLLEMAGGSTAALHRARARVESRLTDRPTRRAEAPRPAVGAGPRDQPVRASVTPAPGWARPR